MSHTLTLIPIPDGTITTTLSTLVITPDLLVNNKSYILGRGGQTARPDVVINDKRISRLHCNILYNESTHTYSVENYSKNGIWVNNIHVAKNSTVTLTNNDVLALTSDVHAGSIGQIKYTCCITSIPTKSISDPTDTKPNVTTTNVATTLASVRTATPLPATQSSTITQQSRIHTPTPYTATPTVIQSVLTPSQAQLPVAVAAAVTTNPANEPSIATSVSAPSATPVNIPTAHIVTASPVIPQQYYVFHLGAIQSSIDICNSVLHELSNKTKYSGSVVSFDANALSGSQLSISSINLPYTVLHLIDCLLYGIDRVSYSTCLTHRSEIERKVLTQCKKLNNFILSSTPTSSQIAATLRLDSRISHLRDTEKYEQYQGAAAKILICKHDAVIKLQQLELHHVDCVILYTRPHNDDNNAWLFSIVTNTYSLSKCHVLQPLVASHQPAVMPPTAQTYTPIPYHTQFIPPTTASIPQPTSSVTKASSIDSTTSQPPNRIVDNTQTSTRAVKSTQQSPLQHSPLQQSTQPVTPSTQNSSVIIQSPPTSHIDQLKQYNIPIDMTNTQTLRSTVLSPALSYQSDEAIESNKPNGGRKRKTDSPVTKNRKRAASSHSVANSPFSDHRKTPVQTNETNNDVYEFEVSQT